MLLLQGIVVHKIDKKIVMALECIEKLFALVLCLIRDDERGTEIHSGVPDELESLKTKILSLKESYEISNPIIDWRGTEINVGSTVYVDIYEPGPPNQKPIAILRGKIKSIYYPVKELCIDVTQDKNWVRAMRRGVGEDMNFIELKEIAENLVDYPEHVEVIV